MTKTERQEVIPADETTPADLPLTARIEALLISSDRPMTDARLGALLDVRGKGVTSQVCEAIERLNAEYEQTGRSFRVERLAGGWQILTGPTFGPLLSRLHQDRQQSRLSQAALETLAIIAYRQPLLRAEIEAVRGVACGEVLRGLLDRRLVKIVGRAEVLGRPMLYGTTREFLKVFGLAGLDDLPEVEGLKRQAGYISPAPEPLADLESVVAAESVDSEAGADGDAQIDGEASSEVVEVADSDTNCPIDAG